MAHEKPRSKPSPFTQSVRREVLRRMQEEGISQAKLARELGCSPANVSKVLHGDSDLQGETISKFVRAVGLEISVVDPQDRSAEDSADGVGHSLVSSPKKRKAGTKTGHRYDYSSRHAHMARLIVEAELRGEKLSEREAAGTAVDWAKGQEHLVPVTAGTLRRHFAEDRELLLDEARREPAVSHLPRKEQAPAVSRRAGACRSVESRPTGSRPGLGGPRLRDEPGMVPKLTHALEEQFEKVNAADPDLTAPAQARARKIRADIRITKLTNPVGEVSREFDESRRYARLVRIPSLADFSFSARLPEVGLTRRDPYFEAHREMKRTFEELRGPTSPNLTRPWSWCHQPRQTRR